jgi:ABC-type glycerol-3-phosphate transport system substrate-binding protein
VWNGLSNSKNKKKCREARSLVVQQLDDQLPGPAAARLNAHLATCPACRYWARQEEALRDRLRFELDPPWTLTAAAATHNRAQILARVRRKSIMVQTRQAAQGLVALALLIVVAAGLLLWWQNNPPTPLVPDATPAPQEADQVVLILAVESTSLSRYQPLIEQFEAEQPHIRVRLVSVGDVANGDDSGIRALASSFDVFSYSPSRQGETQYLLNLRPFLDIDPHFDPDDFLPGLLTASPEPLWAVPTGAAYYLTFFDQRAIDAEGISYPELDWTLDDFLAAAVALTTREGGEVTQWGYVPAQLRYSPLLATQLTGPLQTGDGLRLSDPDVITAVQWLSDLFTVHQVSPWLDDYRPAERRSGSDGQSALGLINAGRAAMWHTTHVLYDENDEQVGVTAVPRGRHGLAAEPIIYGFGVSRGTANPEAAWQLLTFLSRQPPQDMAFVNAPVPARRSIAATTNYWEQLPAALTPALRYTAENSVQPRIPLLAVDLLQQALAEHIEDNTPVAAALGQLPAQPSLPPDEEEPVIVVPISPPNDDAQAIRITFATESGLLEAQRRLAIEFQEKYPDINIQIVAKDRFVRNVLDRIAGSDCFVGEPGFWQDDEVRAVLLPFTPLLEIDGALHLDDFYPVLVEPLLVDGELWGIPAWISPPYLEFNRQLFVEAGITSPPLDWSLDDFLHIARQLTTGDGETKQYAYAQFAPYFWLGSFDAFGVDVVDNSTAVPNFNYEAAAEMIGWHVDLIRLHQVQPLIGDMDTPNFDEFHALLRSGRLAMWPGGSSFGAVMLTGAPLSFSVGVASMPIGPAGYRSAFRLAPTAYHIASVADSSQRQACWKWIKFLAAEPTAVQVHVGTSSERLMPAHIEVAHSEAYVSLVGEEMAAVFQDFLHFLAASGPATIPLSPPWMTPPWMSPGHGWLRDAYWQAVTGEATVTEALANADVKFSRHRQCVIDNDAFNDEAGWRACAAEAGR